MGCTVRCQVCNYYRPVDDCRAYGLRFITDGERHTEPRLEAVELGGREPWSGIRLVCKPCLAFLRTLDPRPGDRLPGLIRAYVDSLDRAAEMVASGDAPPTNDAEMALRAVADDLRAIVGSQVAPGAAHEPGEVQSVEPGAGGAPRGSQEPTEGDKFLSDCIPW